MNSYLQSLIVIGILLILSACYHDPDYLEESDFVYTNYDASFDFKSTHTFSLPEQVVKIEGSEYRQNGNSDEPAFVTSAYRNIILSRIRENMTALGWTEVSRTSNPDVVLLPSVSSTTSLYYYYDPYYWNWWYPGSYGGWGWYYPGAYYPVYTNAYSSGTLLIQMTDGTNSGNSVNVRWTAIINGLLIGSPASITDRINKTIDQAFEQSPYLSKN